MCTRPRSSAGHVSRRATVARLALQVAQESLSPGQLASVFACSGGSADALDKTLSGLSPYQFAGSGHSALSGPWSIVFGSPTTSVGAYDGSFAAELLEAIKQAQEENVPVLLVAYDVSPRQALVSRRRNSRAVRNSFAVHPALLNAQLLPSACSNHLRSLRRNAANSGLESIRAGNPAGHCLPLLRLMALSKRGSAVLRYLAPLQRLIEHVPC